MSQSIKPVKAARWVICSAAALLLAACNTAGSPAGLEQFAFSLPKTQRDVVIACRPGPTAADTSQRAQASATIVDAGLFALGENIRAQVEQASRTGSEFSSRELVRLSRATGLRLARTIDDEHDCFLID